MKDSKVAVGEGRELAYTDIGEPDGPCLFFFHGAPASRFHILPLEEQFARRGLRVVSPDRPGYGGSSSQPGRSMADWPTDVVGLADALQIDRFLVAGHSSGGPYAVACAALLGERVLGGALLAAVTDMAWSDAWDGYPEDETRIMRMRDEDAAVALCAERYGPDGARFFEEEPFQFPEPDLALLDEALEQAVAESFRQGVAAYAQDIHVQGSAWPFDPGQISAPVDVLHGELDTLLPIAHSRHTAELIPGARFRAYPGHGHLSILTELPAIAAALVLARA